MMDIESRPWDREEQTELPEPIKVRLTGKLRTRINERARDCDHDEVYIISQYRAYSREKSNIVIETEEEAYAVLGDFGHYTMNGIHWMNGPMLKAARRVKREIQEQLDEMGVEIDR